MQETSVYVSSEKYLAPLQVAKAIANGFNPQEDGEYFAKAFNNIAKRSDSLKKISVGLSAACLLFAEGTFKLGASGVACHSEIFAPIFCGLSLAFIHSAVLSAKNEGKALSYADAIEYELKNSNSKVNG